MSSPVTARLFLIQRHYLDLPAIIELRNTTTTLGRAQSADVVLNHSNINMSRKHLEFDFKDPLWYIRDTSANGVKLNNERLLKGQSTPVFDGDLLSMTGDIQYRFVYANPPPHLKGINSFYYPNGYPDILNLPFSTANDEQVQPETRTEPVTEEAIVEDCRSNPDDRNRHEPLVITQPKDVINPGRDDCATLRQNESLVLERKRHPDSSESRTEDRKKKRIENLNLAVDSSDGNGSTPPSGYSCGLECTTRTIADPKVDNIQELIEKLRKCETRLQKTELELKALKCKRDMEREEFRRKERDIQSVNAALKEENAKKILELIESELSCAICSDVFINATVIDCGHTFCNYCINEWTRQKNQCPICRKFLHTKLRHIEVENFLNRAFEYIPGEIAAERKINRKERDRVTKEAAEDARRHERNLDNWMPRYLREQGWKKSMFFRAYRLHIFATL